MATSTVLAKRPSDTDLMPPPPPPKRIKRPPKILDEDTYTNALSSIIARDFFPGLLETEAQQDYLSALEAGNVEWIRDAEYKVRAAMTPGPRGRRGVSMTPLRGNGFNGETPREWRGETPRSTRSTVTPVRHLGESGVLQDTDQQGNNSVDLNMGLTAFQAKYTSEDNESFNKVLDKQNIKRAEKYRWMWNGNKLPSKQQLAQAAQRQKLLPPSNAMPTSSSAANITDTKALTLRPSQNLEDRAPIMATKPPTTNPRNGFMFTPTDLSETHPEHQTMAEAAQEASSAPPKRVEYANTRLPTLTLSADSDTIPPSPSISAIDAAIAGHPRHRADSTIYANSSVPGGETPRVNGYAFVDAEATPSELGMAEEDRDSTSTSLLQQLISDSSSSNNGTSGRNPFTIHEPRKRESLHHRLVARSLASKRRLPPSASHPQTPIGSSTPTSTSTSTSTVSSLHTHILSRLDNGRTPTPKFASSPRIVRGADAYPATPVGLRARAGGGGNDTGGLTPAAQQLYRKLGKTPLRGTGSGGGLEAFGFHSGSGAGSGGSVGVGNGRGKNGIGESKRSGCTPTPLGVKARKVV